MTEIIHVLNLVINDWYQGGGTMNVQTVVACEALRRDLVTEQARLTSHTSFAIMAKPMEDPNDKSR